MYTLITSKFKLIFRKSASLIFSHFFAMLVDLKTKQLITFDFLYLDSKNIPFFTKRGFTSIRIQDLFVKMKLPFPSIFQLDIVSCADICATCLLYIANHLLKYKSLIWKNFVLNQDQFTMQQFGLHRKEIFDHLQYKTEDNKFVFLKTDQIILNQLREKCDLSCKQLLATGVEIKKGFHYSKRIMLFIF